MILAYSTVAITNIWK